MAGKRVVKLLALACLLQSIVPVRAQNTIAGIVSSIQSGQFLAAVQQCQEALEATPQDPRLWTLEGVAYDRLKRPQQALTAYQNALKIDKASLPALEAAAQLLYQRSDSQAMPLLHQILAIRPDDQTTHAMLAVMLYRSKDYPQAVNHFQKGESAIANQPAALAQYGCALAQLGQYEEAVPAFQKALALQPDLASVRYDLALDQWLANHAQDAAGTLQPLLQSREPSEDAVSLGADIYESEQNTPAAVELLRRAIQIRPREVENYLAFAMLSYNHGSFQAGVDMIDFALTQIPNAANLYLVQGILYSELSQLDKAMADFERANKLDPHLALTFTAEGIVHSQRHDLKAAVGSFRSEAKRHPNDALTQYLLAEALAQQVPPVGSPEHKEEIDAANRAVKLNPRLVQAHDLLSTVYLQEGETNPAIEHSQAALRVSPDDQAAIYHLILALRRAARNDEIPPLIKQLAQLRQADQSESHHKQGFRLSVEQLPETRSQGSNNEEGP